MMNISLEGKTAIVCGSTQGIGLAIAKEFSDQGAKCMLLARNETSLQNAIAQLSTKYRQSHSHHVADFSKPQEVRAVIEKILSSNSVQILVNNTGGPPAGPIKDADEEEFLSAFQQHLICNHILVKAVIPLMKDKGYGRIINIISTSVKIPLRNLGVSNTTRGAVASWAKTLSYELGQFNITVNNILPGFTETERLESLIQANAKFRNVQADEIRKIMINEIPMGRFGQTSEIAAMAAFLASPAASYINGVSIPVDGGRTGTI